MDLLLRTILEAWHLFWAAAPYMLLGLVFSGLLKTFLSTDLVSRHLGRGRIGSVFKAALLGIPIPLCSCGVLPAAAALKKQGANNGATTAFLISTPESGVDSIAVTWALLDPVMTVARPVAAFTTAFVAGLAENLLGWKRPESSALGAGSAGSGDCGCATGSGDCATFVSEGEDSEGAGDCASIASGEGCCSDGAGEVETTGFWSRVVAGLRYSATDVWGDIAPWFYTGLLVAGAIAALVPTELLTGYLGGGILSMLLMLVVGIPLYICATGSTPVAAALILKGVSPGAALVFLLTGPATNITSLTVLLGILGRRATVIYLTALAVCSVSLGLAVDALYRGLGLEAGAIVGQAAEVVPEWIHVLSVAILAAISLIPLRAAIAARLPAAPGPVELPLPAAVPGEPARAPG